jgi:hypothetical protein
MTYITRLQRFRDKAPKAVFSEIYSTNDWGSTESVSGKGSTKDAASIIIKELPEAFNRLKIKRLYDAACGDFNWMKDVVGYLDYYKGADIVDELINSNIEKYESDKIKFVNKNIITGLIVDENFDAILLRDVLVHLPEKYVQIVLDKIKASGIKYLITTNFHELNHNRDIEAFGLWRPINLTIPPYNMNQPFYRIQEINQSYMWLNERKNDKELAIWKIG